MTAPAQTSFLLTPGPLTTSARTRAAMQRDWGSREDDFIALTASLCDKLLAVVRNPGTHVCVPLQGSGTFAVEAAIGTLVPRDGKLLVLVNGAYGKRIVKICQMLGRAYVELAHAEDTPVDPQAVAAALAADPAITHVAAIHCETTTGLWNPLEAVAEVVQQAGRKLIVDAMSSFGALPLHLDEVVCEAVIAASGKCLEGVPGMGFVLIHEQDLLACTGNSHSLALDLADQYVNLRRTGQWRFTPPTHVLAALHEALLQFEEEGGQPARYARYAENCRTLIAAMDAHGLKRVLPDDLQAPIIITFLAPEDPAYDFKTLYDRAKAKGYVLYPGKLTQLETFRVGCIGDLRADDMARAGEALLGTLREMGVKMLMESEA